MLATLVARFRLGGDAPATASAAPAVRPAARPARRQIALAR
jgi:hypothetical protein